MRSSLRPICLATALAALGACVEIKLYGTQPPHSTSPPAESTTLNDLTSAPVGEQSTDPSLCFNDPLAEQAERYTAKNLYDTEPASLGTEECAASAPYCSVKLAINYGQAHDPTERRETVALVRGAPRAYLIDPTTGQPLQTLAVVCRNGEWRALPPSEN